MGYDHRRRYGFLLSLKSSVHSIRTVGLTLLAFGLVGQICSTSLEVTENTALKKTVLQSIEKYYFKSINIEELKKKTLSEIFESLDNDSALVKSLPKELDYVRGFKKKNGTLEERLLVGGVGYIRFNSFKDSTFQEFLSSHKKLVEEGAKNWIFDLRGNEGGNFKSALKLVECFVPYGELVGAIQYKERVEITLSENKMPWNDRVVLLVDSKTASSAEFLVKSLKKNLNSQIVGLPTAGKRTIQQMIPLHGMWLSLTVGEWCVYENKMEEKMGPIDPDYILKDTEEQMKKAISLLQSSL